MTNCTLHRGSNPVCRIRLVFPHGLLSAAVPSGDDAPWTVHWRSPSFELPRPACGAKTAHPGQSASPVFAIASHVLKYTQHMAASGQRLKITVLMTQLHAPDKPVCGQCLHTHRGK